VLNDAGSSRGYLWTDCGAFVHVDGDYNALGTQNKGWVGNGAVVFKAPVPDWYKWDNMGRMVGSNAFYIAFSTKKARGTALQLAFEWGAGNQDGNFSWSFPLEWKAEYAVDGGEFQPLGVFTDKEVEHVDAKTLSNDDLADSNGKITADFPVFVRSKVLAKNVDDNKLGWAFNSVLEGYLMNLKTTTGAYIYRDEMNTGKLLGFPYRVSNQITTDTSGLTELAFGNWADLLVGEQMGLETYTTLDGSWVDEEGNQHNAFEENLAATRALMYVDIAARHKESFLHVKNIKAF